MIMQGIQLAVTFGPVRKQRQVSFEFDANVPGRFKLAITRKKDDETLGVEKALAEK